MTESLAPSPDDTSERPAPVRPAVPAQPGERIQWGQLHGSAAMLLMAAAAEAHPGLVLVVAEDMKEAAALERGLGFFLSPETPVLAFPDWETLPYDIFSPLPELVSQRLSALHRLPGLAKGVIVTAVGTLMQRLPPRRFLDAHAFDLAPGDRVDIDALRGRLNDAGYHCVSQVMSNGEYAVRGALLDIYPMGSDWPYRLDLLDDELESIRTFDPETQRTRDRVERMRMLPAREFPLDKEGITRFRRAFRNAFEGDPQRSLVYREVSQGNAPGGLEYYLPLFFEETATLFDFLPDDTLVIHHQQCAEQLDAFMGQVEERYEQRRHDPERPLLPPDAIFTGRDETLSRLHRSRTVACQAAGIASRQKGFADFVNYGTRPLPPLSFQARTANPARALLDFCAGGDRVLFLAESRGRREMLRETLGGYGLRTEAVESWQAFLASGARYGLAVGPLEQGLWLQHPGLALITETQLLGERVRQERRRRSRYRDAEQVVRNLTELHVGAPVVHEDHGVGRYLGLQTLEVGGLATEFLALEYARGDKLYVPVSSLHLIGRYAGTSPENAPLHRLGGDQWERIKRRAAEQVCDVAAELLAIYARRAASHGFAFPPPGDEYAGFAASFEFEETPDQQQAIDAVLADMAAQQPMDRVVCGDVGFGKTEVAMRAAFVAVQGGRQVAVLVPTTLLAQQHFQNFSDRFADWPVRVESLSRFRTARQQKAVFDGLAEGTLDIVVGTHKLLQENVRFKNLGLVIIDEEHRFGVRQKERLKALRSEVDLLTLTATPIPRTLNMAMAGMRDLSIIATPPAARHPIKTFITEWSPPLIVEACQREIKRGGQVYFLHNEVSTIDATAARLAKLLPGARIQVAHGQMRERELEAIMRDFYHQRFNILVCTTIIESGIDVPSANTILINRADKLGLAQLHQLRGRVGRSHHRAYAYLIAPPFNNLTQDAKKRLEAIESAEELGAGFTLATHDLEIRGAGELLGDEQSGQIHEIGFALYAELLDRAVKAMKAGRQPDLDRPLDHGAEIDLQLPTLLPEDYLPDVHARLVLYKRIASAADADELRELQVEMIDRFGPLPEPARALFDVTALKLLANPMGVRKIEAGPEGGRILFQGEPRIDPARVVRLIQTKPQVYRLDGGDRIRFSLAMPERSERIARVESVLLELAGRAA